MAARRKPARKSTTPRNTGASSAKVGAKKASSTTKKKAAAKRSAGQRRGVGGRTHLLSVGYEDRNLAKWGGAKWDAEMRRWTYAGSDLPESLRRFGAVAHSPERWFEDELNGTVPDLSPGKGVKLRPHQVEAAEHISDAHQTGSVGFLLADDVGLGKTYSVIEGVNRIGTGLRVLVLAPLSVVPHWRRSITTYGDGGNRWCVSNYDRVKSLLEVPDAAEAAVRTRTKNKRIATKGRSLVEWDVVVCDEAHRLKNPTSQRSAAVRNVIAGHGQPAFVVWVSATAGQTPLELAYLAPLLAQRTGSKVKDLSDFESWCRSYGLRIRRGSFGQWSWERNEEDLTAMRKLLFDGGGVGLRRRPQDIAGWPEVVRVLIPVDLDGSQRGLYEEAWEEFCAALRLVNDHSNPTNPMVAALRFRQKASLLRAEQAARFANDLVEDGLQVAVSTQFLETARQIRERIPESCIISGETPAGEREAVRVAFQRGEHKVAIFTVTEGISLHAGEAAVGANNAERALIVHDLRWSALDMAQIEGRCHRDGEKAVAYYTYGSETVEENVAAAVIAKLSDMASMLGDDRVGLDALLEAGGWES